MERVERMVGALLGVHAGDALGAGLEFSTWQQIQRRHPAGPREITGGGPLQWPAGHATDDTDLTWAVLLAYLNPGADVVRAAADHMLAWLTGDWPGRRPDSRPVDIGGATAAGLARYQRSGDPRRAGAGAGQAGNGSLMRAVPTALAVPARPDRVRDAVEISAITHDDPRCTASCAGYVEAVAMLLAGAPADEAIAAAEVTVRELGVPEVVAAIQAGRCYQLAHAAATGELGLAGAAGGYVLDSLTLAIAAVLDRRRLPDVLVDVVRIGNDTDTNAAIAGGLLGARDGAGAIPQRWRTPLQFGDEFTAAARALAAARWC